MAEARRTRRLDIFADFSFDTNSTIRDEFTRMLALAVSLHRVSKYVSVLTFSLMGVCPETLRYTLVRNASSSGCEEESMC